MSVQHTPGPMCVGETRTFASRALGERHEVLIHVGEAANRGNCVAIVHMGGLGAIYSGRDAVEATAHHIVRCVNTHDELLEALIRVTRQLKHEHPEDEAWQQAEALIAKIEGAA